MAKQVSKWEHTLNLEENAASRWWENALNLCWSIEFLGLFQVSGNLCIIYGADCAV